MEERISLNLSRREAAALAAAVLIAPPVDVLAATASASESLSNSGTLWPSDAMTTRPWARWWWPGSAVEPAEITRLLEIYRASGLGGVEITPIYGIQAQEHRDIPYLSASWVSMLQHTITVAQRLGMGVDMATGTGWPFGGPNVTQEDSRDRLEIKSFAITTDGPTVHMGSNTPVAILAISAEGRREVVPLSAVSGSDLHWIPPAGSWSLFVATVRWSGMNVKRAAPGGEGRCIDPFSKESVLRYLERFNSALSELPRGAVRCQFHDSFEYAATAPPDLFVEFHGRHGYDLGLYLPEMTGHQTSDTARRVRTDYLNTISDLLRENFTETWTDWSHRYGCISRNQAHGSPGNLLDLYGSADIPETEIFAGRGDIRVNKFASSPAHVLGKRLVSSETCTWLGEHFQVTLGDCKRAIDRLFCAGINHIIYHGVCYSPSDAVWPGWLFYAAVDFKPTDPIWRDFGALNSYVTRCQSLLQSGDPDNDVLLYWPIDDLRHKSQFFGLTIEGQWLTGQPIGATAQTLLDQGFAFDYISDRQLKLARGKNGAITLPGGAYRAIVVPPCDMIPIETLEELLRLAEEGAIIIFEDQLPTDVPGLADLDARRTRRRELVTLMTPRLSGDPPRPNAAKRRWIMANGHLPEMLERCGVERERFDHPRMLFVRRRTENGRCYFVANQGDRAYDGWFEPAMPATRAVIMDPMTGAAGAAETQGGARAGRVKVRLQIPAGSSILIRTYIDLAPLPRPWPCYVTAGEPIVISGVWRVTVLEGGPVPPRPFETANLGSWTDADDAEWRRFAGTASYAIAFDLPAASGRKMPWRIELGDVRESARVRLNGRDLGVVIASPFHVFAESMKPVGNVLEVEVTNLAANRIRDLDRRAVQWKIMREINFVNLKYKPFDASQWPIRPSGLMGPVRLAPISREDRPRQRPNRG